MAFDWKHERRWLASLGVALAAAGFVRYTTQNELTTLSKGLLIGGGIFFLAARGAELSRSGRIFRPSVVETGNKHV